MQRVKPERDRGAVAVVVALLMVALIGTAAVSVDVANMWSDKRQLQNGADAAALAIAQECASGACGNPTDTAEEFATLNKNDNLAKAEVELDQAAGKVRVVTRADTDHWFAPIFGLDSSEVGAVAAAAWGPAGSATSALPLTFSVCEIAAMTDGSFQETPTGSGNWELKYNSTQTTTIYLDHPGSSKDGSDGCTSTSSGVEIPGGFSWITDGLDDCSAFTAIGYPVPSDTGNPGPGECSADYLQSLIGHDVVLPIFGESGGSGSGGSYTIYGYVGFTLEGLFLQTQGNGPIALGDSSGCNAGNGQCIRGKFTKISDGTGTSSPTAPNTGASNVRLTD